MTAFNPHEYLNSFNNFESKLHQLRPEDFNLSRVEKFLEIAGNPAKNLTIVHVAGTKGKGSTCAMLARILQEAGYKTGLYTSPHLFKVNERINVSGRDITDDDLSDVLQFLKPLTGKILNEGSFLTYFEVLTAAALCFFARQKVDVVVLETGLGGRLDATNAVASKIAVITPVSFDHVNILGDTLAKIAAEKAGIIKNIGQQVIVAPQPPEAMDVILRRCNEFGIKPVLVELNEDIKTALKGQHQALNATVAVAAAGLLEDIGFKITDQSIHQGLMNVRWPGRFELIASNPDTIVDCAHNEASSKALAETLDQEYPKRRVVLVLGISQDKDLNTVAAPFQQNTSHIILTRADHPRARRFTQDEAKHYFGNKPFEIIDDVARAVHRARETASSSDVIVVTGSVFVVAEAISGIKHVSV